MKRSGERAGRPGNEDDFLAGARVLVMGLGAHGGGAASARYCAARGARVTVTDLRSEADLAQSLESLSDLPIRYVLGTHREEDFREADLVVKNPAVRRSSALLRLARRIETDVSLFLGRCTGPVLGVTGTKGKSSVASALHHILLAVHRSSRLAGNITISPLSFVEDLAGDEPVVLELSSFQLGDLPITGSWAGKSLPGLTVAVLTNLVPDHLDYYTSLEEYAADKALIFANPSPGGRAIAPAEGPFAGLWAADHPGAIRFRRNPTPGSPPLPFSAPGTPSGLLPSGLRVPGEHMRANLQIAALTAWAFGVSTDLIAERLASYPGIPHRLEHVATIGGVRFVNDSAATIPDAALAGVASFPDTVHLIAGGSDKGLSIEPFVRICRRVGSLHLLEGTATAKIASRVAAEGLRFAGPYPSLEQALTGALAAARPGDVVLLSPGCASFGMFANEFDRGDRFRALVLSRQ